MSQPFDLSELLPQVRQLSTTAAAAILEIYQRRDFAVDYKADKTPVTAADYQSHAIIKAGLARLTPELPLLSEESADVAYEQRRQWESYWLVDPLDGTREFINKRDDFTINIALIHQGKAILGLVAVPTKQSYYSAASRLGAYKHVPHQPRQRLHARSGTIDQPVITVSRSHSGEKTVAFLKRFGRHRLLRRGSAIKYCLIAEGRADLYPRFGKTGEWDTAAGQCVLEEAGGFLTDFQHRPLRYNSKASLINPPFVAYSPAAADGWQSCCDAEDAEQAA